MKRCCGCEGDMVTLDVGEKLLRMSGGCRSKGVVEVRVDVAIWDVGEAPVFNSRSDLCSYGITGIQEQGCCGHVFMGAVVC